MKGAAGLRRLPWLAVLVVYAGVAFTHLGGLSWNFDEGIELQKAWLMLSGHPLFTQIWTDQPPGHAVLMTWAFRLLGVSVTSGRALSVLFGLVGLFAVLWAVRELLDSQGRSAKSALAGGIAAMACLAIAPNFFWASRAAMMGLATFSLATLAMALTFSYLRTRDARWIAGAGLALGLAVWIKLQMAYLAPLLAVAVVAARGRRAMGALVRDLALAIVTCALPLGLSLLVFDPRALLDQSLGTYLATRALYPVNLAENWGVLRLWLSADNAGLAVLSLWGAIVLLSRRTWAGALALVWLGLTVITPLQHAPLWIQDHFEPLLFAMAAHAGVAVGDLFDRTSGFRRLPERRSAIRWCLPGALALAAYLGSVGHILAVDRSLLVAREYENDGHIVEPGSEEWANAVASDAELWKAVDYVRANSRPGEIVVTDQQIIAFYAGRQVPPELATISSRRLRLGTISDELLIRVTERSAAPIVLRWKAMLWQYKAYRDWVHALYEKGADFEQGRRSAWVLPRLKE